MSGDLENETSSSSATEVQILGRVKWFNNKAGYGFITISEGEQSEKDIFVHHSGIKVNSEQYRYLVQGEYVQFILDNTPNGSHAVQAKAVSGINGGMLMCETRKDFRQTRYSFKEDNDGEPSVKPRSARPPRNSRREISGRGSRGPNVWSLADNK
jgi:cold shock protein